ncbi:response regulator [Ferrimonas sp. YFM]|uniref:response regulator n=1 Tax=Ferrimonas sp. YFM TaxID=3028878 RepID=UPI002572D58D|nr:response regulator [Ferrimonas sp. YFM]BDY04127.1 DNA-binding response regulator [Ferrimonas sp. YFM]
MKILIIEDEPAIADTLVHVLEMEGFDTLWHTTARQGLAVIEQGAADLVVLDVGLPDMSGFELCKQIRSFSSLPIIFLTARGDEIDRVVGLEIGADDYVTKPFSPREVLARVKLRLRARPQPDQAEVPTDLRPENYDYWVRQQPLGLTTVEYRILHKLVESVERVLSREQLMDAAQMPAEAAYERNIDSHIKAIRAKLKPFGLQGRVRTKRGFGYLYSIRNEQ